MNRKFEVVVENCPDDVTAFEICEAVRKSLNSEYGVRVKEKEEDD